MQATGSCTGSNQDKEGDEESSCIINNKSSNNKNSNNATVIITFFFFFFFNNSVSEIFYIATPNFSTTKLSLKGLKFKNSLVTYSCLEVPHH